jgi:hypothetical protein
MGGKKERGPEKEKKVRKEGMGYTATV